MVLKGLFLSVLSLGVCGGLERTGFWIMSHWEGVVVLKGQIFDYCLIWLCQITICGI